ncbi:hypothetical protein PV367_02820 [Streptomyces europaeiscabiei]|uniref:Uncharacterized protein n=1 Tax=Streptomyces europaeiscabiei TaxID=146819 RepID=A0AAJ2PJY0_9ACTN|nr:hypothetical protein [Streptomyces europaeiscabiei]MDX3128755.1 hypothetical protein [Streptomyces europaeiscabiei]
MYASFHCWLVLFWSVFWTMGVPSLVPPFEAVIALPVLTLTIL